MIINVKCLVGVTVIQLIVLKEITAAKLAKDAVDKVIEDEITQKLSVDLMQSIEKKFQIDLEKSVDMVLAKIKLLLQNGTAHIQDKLVNLQGMIDVIKKHGEKELDTCLIQRQNETSALAEKALHQMVVCGYALIGHDPAQAVSKVLMLKNMITDGIKPIYEKKSEVYGLLKMCGHDHETLKKVIKCVISKSPIIKSTMMEITGRVIEGIVELTKLMAHGAMHEACLIEVIKTTEDEAMNLINKVKVCVNSNGTIKELQSYLIDNNATVLDVKSKLDNAEAEEVKEMHGLVSKMLIENSGKDLTDTFKSKLLKLQEDIGSVDENHVSNYTKEEIVD